MAWYASSIFSVPIAVVLMNLTGISPWYFQHIAPTKHSTLPPVEFIPLLLLPLIGAWFAYIGIKEKVSLGFSSRA